MKIESYACKGAHKKNSNNRKPAIGEVVAELVRAPHACPHVASPQPPLLLHGCDPNEIPDMARALASGALNRAGHKLRCDSPVALLGVATWPIPSATIEIDLIQRKKYLAWRRDTVGYLKNVWSDELVCVVEHSDETYPHVHFCVLPKLPPHRRLTIAAVHPGHRAAMDALKDGLTRRQQKSAYNAAMVALQDQYYQEVGAKHGLTRLGPRRQRLSREEWKDQNRQAEALALRGQHLEALEIAAEHDLAERSAILDEEAKLMVAAAQAEAEKRVASVKRIAVDHITRAGERLENERQAKDRIIALQEEENAEMRRVLAEHGISVGPKI